MPGENYFEVASTVWNTSGLIQSLKLIYNGTPQTAKMDELRETAVKIAPDHANELFEIEQFVTLCKENGQIATNTFQASLALSPKPLTETVSIPKIEGTKGTL